MCVCVCVLLTTAWGMHACSGVLANNISCALLPAAGAPTNHVLCVFQWGPDDDVSAPRGRGLGEEALYDNAVLYDNLPSPKIFARYPPADRKAARPSPDRLSCNHYKHPASSGLPSSPSVTNTSSVGRASLGLSSQVQHPHSVVSSSLSGTLLLQGRAATEYPPARRH